MHKLQLHCKFYILDDKIAIYPLLRSYFKIILMIFLLHKRNILISALHP